MNNCRGFISKASDTHKAKLKPLFDALGLASKRLDLVRAFFCEGLLVQALANKESSDSAACIRAELASVAGGRIQETLLLPSLLEAARDFIG